MPGLARLHRHAPVALVVGLLWFARSARADAADEAQQAFMRGVEATHDGRWLDARSEFVHSLQLSPKLTTHFNLAVTDLKLGLGEEALRELAAFEAQATPAEHGDLLARVPRLRERANALVASRPPPPSASDGPLSLQGLSDAAAAHNVAGRYAYEHAQDTLALSSFEAAYEASGRAELLFNIGLAADRLRADEHAVAAYEAFATALPALPQAAYARARVTVLRAALAARAQLDVARELSPAVAHVQAVPPPQAAPPAQVSLTAPRAVTLSGAALSLALIGTGFWWNHGTEAIAECARSDLCDNDAQLQRQHRAAIATTVTLAVASVGLVVGGAIWLAQSKKRRRQSTPELGLRGVLLRF